MGMGIRSHSANDDAERGRHGLSIPTHGRVALRRQKKTRLILYALRGIDMMQGGCIYHHGMTRNDRDTGGTHLGPVHIHTKGTREPNGFTAKNDS